MIVADGARKARKGKPFDDSKAPRKQHDWGQRLGAHHTSLARNNQDCLLQDHNQTGRGAGHKPMALSGAGQLNLKEGPVPPSGPTIYDPARIQPGRWAKGQSQQLRRC